jgi:hypothetical protein
MVSSAGNSFEEGLIGEIDRHGVDLSFQQVFVAEGVLHQFEAVDSHAGLFEHGEYFGAGDAIAEHDAAPGQICGLPDAGRLQGEDRIGGMLEYGRQGHQGLVFQIAQHQFTAGHAELGFTREHNLPG